jgi:hypothetical protein
VQLALAATVAAVHVLRELVKSVEPFPPTAILEMCSGAAPLLVMVTLIGMLVKP